MNEFKKITMALLLIFFVLTAGCNAKLKLEMIFSGTFKDAQTVYINNGKVYIPDGGNLERVSRDGKETILSRNDLHIFMGFGGKLKTIGTTAYTFLLLDDNDQLVGEVRTFDGSTPILSKNDEILIIFDAMEEVTKIFRTDGTLLWDFNGLRTAADVTADGKKAITNIGEIVLLDERVVKDIPNFSSYALVHVVDSDILFASRNGYVTICDIDGNLKWQKPVGSISVRYTLLSNLKLIVYTNNRIICVRL